MKKIICILLLVCLCGCKSNDLPLPQADPESELGVDLNVNVSTIDKYLGRDDAVYRDMRMLVDEAQYENVGGDSYLSGFVKGFEVVPYPYLCNVEGLPEVVGETYTGTTLFTNNNGEYSPNYEESMHILESLFPKDKIIFLMCGGGGYAGMAKNMLVSLGWDETKIYNVGGYWFYEGENRVDIKYEEDSKEYYNLAFVNYHEIYFNSLNPIGEEKVDPKTAFKVIKDVNELNEVINNKKTFALYVYLPGCATCAIYTPLVKQFKTENDIDMYGVSLDDIWKQTNAINERIKVSPALFLFKDGEVLEYLDYNKIQELKSADDIKNWFEAYVDLSELQEVCDTCEIE